MPTFVTEANALAASFEALEDSATTAAATATIQAGNASDSAAAAALSEAAAAAGSSATAWVSGTTYAIGDVRWSPITLQSYRRKTAGAGTTDPSADATNWAHLGAQTADAIRATLGITTLSGSNTGDQTDIPGNAATATRIAGTTTWNFVETAGVLYFKVNGVSKAKLDASGNLTVIGNVTAYGTM